MKIVIIDDNSFLISSIKEKLSFFEEIQIKFTAANGADLIEKLEKNSKHGQVPAKILNLVIRGTVSCGFLDNLF